MKEEKMVTTVSRMFKDGKLLDHESEREEITEQCVFFPDNLAYGKVSVGRSLPILMYAYGGNANVSVHVSIPFPLCNDQQIEAIKYATELCEKEIDSQFKQYTAYLESAGVDWKKVKGALGE